MTADFEARRLRMVDEQLERHGIRDRRVLAAMREVPRHAFLAPGSWPDAYEDRPVPIGFGQTMSQPYIVAWMAELLELGGSERVLELGAGSGYAAAVLGRLAASVFAIELEPLLAGRAAEALRVLGADNVCVRQGDGLGGWPENAPFDRIMASAFSERVPETLLGQLKAGGWFLGPVGPGPAQRMTRIRRTNDGFAGETLAPVLFVPMRSRPTEQR